LVWIKIGFFLNCNKRKELGIGIWDLGIRIGELGFGIWDLGFGICEVANS
jgi:hypothetical protein